MRVEQNTNHSPPRAFRHGTMQACDGGKKWNLVANNLFLVIDSNTASGVSGITMSGCRKTDIFYNILHLSNGNTTQFQSTTNVAVSLFSFNNDSLRIFNNIFTNMRGREALLYPYESDFNDIYTRSCRSHPSPLKHTAASESISHNLYTVTPTSALRGYSSNIPNSPILNFYF